MRRPGEEQLVLVARGLTLHAVDDDGAAAAGGVRHGHLDGGREPGAAATGQPGGLEHRHEGLAPAPGPRRQRDGSQRRHVPRQVGRMAEEAVAARRGDGAAQARHGETPLSPGRRSARCFGGTRSNRRVRRPRRDLTGNHPQPPRQRHRHRCDAGHAEHDDPALACVRAHAERMGEGDRPAEIRQPVDGSPGPRPHPGPEQAGHEHRDHQVECDGPHADPEPPVRRHERDDDRSPADVDVGVEHAGHDVDPEEDHGDHGDATVHLLLREPGPVPGAGPGGGRHAQHHGQREEDQRHDAAGPRGVPERGRAHDPPSCGHPLTEKTSPSKRTRRAARPKPANLSSACSPQTREAVVTRLASTQLLPVAEAMTQ